MLWKKTEICACQRFAPEQGYDPGYRKIRAEWDWDITPASRNH
jgi:hypothetical protein